ncbi:MAG: hypothetical protein LC650_02760 [Actinobacteria bacterium]|nr:hypothetical protein [Actinomycetota bacterium]
MAKKKTIPIRCASNEVFKVAPPAGVNGAVVSINIECGSCHYMFPRSYTMAQLTLGAFPRETCPNCGVVNYVPYTASGRNDARG